MAAESDFLAWIAAQHQPHPIIQVKIGDDLAVLNWPKDLLLIGADQVLDGVHFDSSVHSPESIGKKVMNRNLSDCAAMACLPAAAVATVALPHGVGLQYAQNLFHGLRKAAEPWDCPIVGGDTGSWPGRLAISITILGRPAGIAPITRSGGRPGDTIHVTGPLGGSLLGRHMTFTPRVDLARQLAAQVNIRSMIDLSDGLSRDLAHICRQSGVGAIIHSAAIPIHPDALTLSARDKKSPLDHAVHDGEDYELLFTSPQPVVEYAIPIGRLTIEPGIWLETNGSRHLLEPKAWEHFL